MGSFATHKKALIQRVGRIHYAAPFWLVAIIVLALLVPVPACADLTNVKKGRSVIEEVIKPVPVPVTFVTALTLPEANTLDFFFVPTSLEELTLPYQPFDDSYRSYSNDLSPPLLSPCTS